MNKVDIAQNIQVLNQVNVRDDHRMVRCKICFSFQWEWKHKAETTQNQQSIQPFQVDLQNRNEPLAHIENNNEISDLDHLNENVMKPLAEATWKHSGTMLEKENIPPEETTILIAKWKTKTTREKIQFSKLNKLVSKKVKNKEQIFKNRRLRQIKNIVEEGKGFKAAYNFFFQGSFH